MPGWSARVVRVLESVLQRVHRYGDSFSEPFLYLPCVQSDRNRVRVDDGGRVNGIPVPVVLVAVESGSRSAELAVLVRYHVLRSEAAAHKDEYRCKKYLLHNGAKIQQKCEILANYAVTVFINSFGRR